MVFGSVISSPRGDLTLKQQLDLANVYLDNASKATDPDIVLVLCHDTEVSLTHVKKAAKHIDDTGVRERIAIVYISLGQLLDNQGRRGEARAFFKKSEKWGGLLHDTVPPVKISPPASIDQPTKDTPPTTSGTITTVDPSPRPAVSRQLQQAVSSAKLPQYIFTTNVRPPTISFSALEPDSRLNDTPQLACCLALLQGSYEPEDILDQAARNWLKLTMNEQDEKDRLKTLATDVIRAFKRDELKDAKAVTEVMYLSPVLEKEDFRYLLKEFYSGIDQSDLLDINQLDGLAQLIQGADPGYLQTDDLVKVLELLSGRLRHTHQQSPEYLYQLTTAVSRVLDAMADTNVKGLDREKLHEPLLSYLEKLKGSQDTYLVYHAAYAYQALLCVPDDETLWQATLRRTGKVVKGVSGLVSAVKALDLNGFIDGLKDIQQGIAKASEMVQVVKDAYENAAALASGGKGFLEGLKEGLCFNRKSAWYAALRGADDLIRDGQLYEFRKLVCQAPCRRDVAFQWGVCQRLGDIAANPLWDTDTRRGSISFLGEIYQDDTVWGERATVKQWILSILMQLSSGSGNVMQYANILLEQLRKDGDGSKQRMYQECREGGPGFNSLKDFLPAMGSPSLLDRVQERPDVEGNIRQLRRQRMNERGNAVYIPPQAKANFQARDESRFPLMENVLEFVSSDQKVFLLLGDSGAGKSTFNRELEYQLWQSYKKTSGVIPLHINLPSIDKPEHDMIAKQLRKLEFTEPQIRELKLHRNFILICDGYDESQQTRNLYTSNRLNQPGEWKAKMIVSCRSEYIGADYRDRFQPGDRNQRPELGLLEEAIIAPFSMGQVHDYIGQYVSVHRPLWEVEDYKKALDLIPSLKELVRNPFMMSLSLEVLPRMVDPEHDLSTTHITRVALYDQFVEHWLERGKKRLGEKNLSPLARAAFESLSDEGFTQNGINFLKKLCKSIYKEQGGQPVVQYSRYKDEGSWKDAFFNREEEKQLLREASPLVRSGNQHRFIHRSLLEYGVALAIYDPQDWKERTSQEPILSRRGSTSSTWSYESQGAAQDVSATSQQEPDINSPLAWRFFVNEPSVLQFLEERVRQEPQFKKQLLGYIEQSKKDKKWYKAASNAMTILVRAGVHFNGADLQGIRIPKADLSYGSFDSAQLQGADLIQVNLQGTWLQKADLSGSRMTGAAFGELPYLKHNSPVKMSAYSPDGKSIAVALYGGQIIKYSTATWEEVHTMDNVNTVQCMVYSPDGTQLAAGSNNTDDYTVRIWHIETGMCLDVLTEHTNAIGCVAYSASGKQLLSASEDWTVKLWDVETGTCSHTLIGHNSYVLSAAYSPNGSLIVSSGADCTVRLWDANSAECLYILVGHTDWVRSAAFSFQGDTIASTGEDMTVRLWDAGTGNCRYVFTRHTGTIYSITYSPRGDQLASCSGDGSVRLWSVNTGVCLHKLVGHIDYVTSVSYSPQGDIIASSSDDKTVRLWDPETGVCRQTLSGHSNAVYRVTFSPIRNQIASSSDDGTVRLWDIGAESSRHVSRGHGDAVCTVRYSPKGNQVATSSSDMTARLWDLESGECRHILRGHALAVLDLVYSPNGYHIATGGFDNTVRLWDTETGACVRTFYGHTDSVNCVVFSPKGDRVASPSDDSTVRFWDVYSGDCAISLVGHTGTINTAEYSPDGNQVVTSSRDCTVRVWDAETGSCVMVLIGHTQCVWRAFYSPQGNEIASYSDDGVVRLWNATTGECNHKLARDDKAVFCIEYSSDSSQVVTGNMYGFMRVWDTATGACLQELEGHTQQASRVKYSPRGDLLASSGEDRSIKFWDVTTWECRTVIHLEHNAWAIEWVQVSGVDHLIIGTEDGSVQLRKLVYDGDVCEFRLHWGTMYVGLTATGMNIQDVRGMSQRNEQLLKQRGAVGEPVRRLREASKKLINMTTVLTKLRSIRNVEQEPSAASPAIDQEAEKVEQENDS